MRMLFSWTTRRLRDLRV